MNTAAMEPTPDLADIFGGKEKLSVDQHDKFETSFGAMDEGTYGFEIERAQLRKTKDYNNNGGGMYISVMFRRLDSNGVYWNNYNVRNQNDKVAERAKSEVATFVGAAGVKDIPSDAEQLVGLQLGIQIGKKQTKDSLRAQKVNPMTAAKEYENFVVKYVPLSEVPQKSEGMADKPANTPGSLPGAPPASGSGQPNLPNF